MAQWRLNGDGLVGNGQQWTTRWKLNSNRRIDGNGRQQGLNCDGRRGAMAMDGVMAT